MFDAVGVGSSRAAGAIPLTAVDARTFWMSAKVPNDAVELFGFAGDPGDLDAAVAELRARARACPDLRLRIADECAARYPRWVPGDLDPTQIAVRTSQLSWADCLVAAARLFDQPLDPTFAAWRLHLFPAVHGAPGPAAQLTVAVLQIAHALADGTRVAELAGWLFGRDQPVAVTAPGRGGGRLRRNLAAARMARRLSDDVASGRIPPPASVRPALSTNRRPDGQRRLHTVVRRRGEFAPDTTVTVRALDAIGVALGGYLRDRGEDLSRLGAEVPVADSGIRPALNHFRNVGIDLHPSAESADRLALIAAQLRDARIRGEHPAMGAQRDALEAMPAAVLRWGVSLFDPERQLLDVLGNTVVSSVNRGAADLRLGAAAVAVTAGYPALSPAMALTHGVHGVGDTVAISVHACPSRVQIDDYIARLEVALG